MNLTRDAFGSNFKFGVATAAYQIEGAHNTDDKGQSIWDTYCHQKGKIKNGDVGDIACDFYHRYPEDLALMAKMGIENFRFSIAWTRIFPNGTGKVNTKGVDFYRRLIDECLKNGIEPWVTLYHWDLPQTLQDVGGWTNRQIIDIFAHYVDFVTRTFSDSVKYWMIFNEPTSFVSLGYFLKMHAPGLGGIDNFLKASHHVNMAMAEAGRVAKANMPSNEVGSTFFMADVQPYRMQMRHRKAADRFDAIVNRLYLEPSLGLGYPTDTFPALQKIEKFMQPDDEQKLKHQFDFIGLQNYSRDVIRFSMQVPILWAKPYTAQDRDVSDITTMGWEVYPQGIYHLLHRLSLYPQIKKIYVTENGASFDDQPVRGGSGSNTDEIHDEKRLQFIQQYMQQVHRAKSEGVQVEGYFIWSFMDNFEWAEGFSKRFGLVYVDFNSQQRIIKDSGKWFTKFLRNQPD